jgi:hypothetical protein
MRFTSEGSVYKALGDGQEREKINPAVIRAFVEAAPDRLTPKIAEEGPNDEENSKKQAELSHLSKVPSTFLGEGNAAKPQTQPAKK